MLKDEALDLSDPSIYEEGVPYAEFARLRHEDPIHWNPERNGSGFWSVTRFADIVSVSKQPALFSSAYEWGGHRIFNENEVGIAGAGNAGIGIPMISRDPPIHTRYRKVTMPALSPGRITGIEDRIRTRISALLDGIDPGSPIDIVEKLSAPYPLITLAELLGVPAEMGPKLFEWTNAFIGEDDPEFRSSPDSIQATLVEFFDFCRQLFDERVARPTGDIISMLATTEIDGKPATFGDFLGNLVLVTVGGNETVRNTTSHAIAMLAINPDQWRHIREDPGLLKEGVREMVRHASPVLHMRRTATQDTELGGIRIKRGDKVVLWYPAGNRDETVIEHPDDFDLTRRGMTHLGFGIGQHICAGSRLAEMQLRVAFEELARRFKDIVMVSPPRRLRSNFISGIKSLEIVLQ